jgi:hypothetical protein
MTVQREDGEDISLWARLLKLVERGLHVPYCFLVVER